MAYKSNKPQITDKFKLSPNDISTNFTDLKTAFDVNHSALTGTGGDEGKHFKLDMPRQTVAPTPSGTDLVLYNAYGSTLTTTPVLWWKNSSFTQPITEGLTATYPSNGWFIHGSGTLIKYGQLTQVYSTSPGLYSFLFPVAANVPAFSTIPFVMAVAISNGPVANLTIRDSLITTTSFTARVEAPNIGGYVVVNYIAIGT